MKLLSIKKYGVRLKATIQATGKLGFPKTTSDILRFKDRQYVKFFLDDNGKDLYLTVLEEFSEDAFKVAVSSGYYSINTAAIFNELQYNYKDKKETFIFDLIRNSQLDAECGGEVYKMNLREHNASINS